MIERLKTWARGLKQNIFALYLAYRDPRTPWFARLAAMLVVAYAVSPLDLIPDFIPVLGYLDDLILLPLGIALTLRLIPNQVLVDAQERVQTGEQVKLKGSTGCVILIWLVIVLMILRVIFA